MATERKTKKMYFSDTEIEVLAGDVEVWKPILFGVHSSGVKNKIKCSKWQNMVVAVNAVSSTNTVPEIHFLNVVRQKKE